MNLKKWSEEQGISYRTALRWFHEGRMPVPAQQVGNCGTILVAPISSGKPVTDGVHLYARVSSHDQREDLNRQLQRLRDYAAANGWPILSETKEIGSGLNGNRTKLLRLLKGDGDLAVEHSDRLARFGVNFIQAALESANRKLHIVNMTESKNELVQDFIDVVASMCARIYGKRSARNKAQRALKAIDETNT